MSTEGWGVWADVSLLDQACGHWMAVSTDGLSVVPDGSPQALGWARTNSLRALDGSHLPSVEGGMCLNLKTEGRAYTPPLSLGRDVSEP